MDTYPYKFEPIYKDKLWGGRNLERLFGRDLPAGKQIGESWELADLTEGVSRVSHGPARGTTLTDLTGQLGSQLLGGAPAMGDGRFPLLLKLLDANDILSLQVHPDAAAVEAIGPEAALKTECWYVLESRDGMIYKGVMPNVSAGQFRQGIETDTVEKLVKPYDVQAGDFHYLPAGTVHALGAGVVIAEVQTPSDTTYRVTDWGRGREIHVERSMQCIHFNPADDVAPGAGGDTLLVTEFFTVARRKAEAGQAATIPPGRCVALMMLEADGPVEVRHAGPAEPSTLVRAGDTVLVPACLQDAQIVPQGNCTWLETTLPNRDS